MVNARFGAAAICLLKWGTASTGGIAVGIRGCGTVTDGAESLGERRKGSAVHVVVSALACLGFGLFWGVSYTHYSVTLLDPGLTTFIEVAVRGFACVLFAGVFWRRGRFPVGLYCAMLVVFAVWYAVGMGAAGPETVATAVFKSLTYSVSMAFLLVWYTAVLYRLSSRVLGVVVPLGFALSYVYGVLVSAGDCRIVANSVAGAVLVLIVLGLSLRGGAAPLLARGRARMGARSRRHEGGVPGSFEMPFVGALVLFLVLVGMWLRLGAGERGSMWLLETPIGLACAAISTAGVAVFWKTGGSVSIHWYSALSFCTLLVVLLVGVLFWDQAPLFVQGFAGLWLVTFQVALFMECGVRDRPLGDRVMCLGVVQGAALACLALGNLVEPCFFEEGLYSQSSFLKVSFAFVFVLAVLVGFGVYGIVRRGGHETVASQASAAPAGDEGWSAALAAVCDRYGVSPQERRVLEGYSRGRSTGYIAEELALSEGTVRTYLKRAYAKMDIHGKQELLDVIERELGVTGR